jgi:CheY-like chemotaxis protein
MLEVRDDGCGMDDDTKSQIFEPFFTSKPRSEGAGLGLSLVYSVVAGSGGSIDIESAPGRGTTVRLYMPRFAEDPRTAVPGLQSAVRPPLPPKPCVMVVENDDNVRKLLVSTLDTKDFSILEASDGEEALEIASRNINHLDLVVTEVAMPQVTGPELATRLSILRPDLGVVYISSYPKPADWDTNGSQPNRSFLFKPFSPGELLARVKFLLSARGQWTSDERTA